MLGLFDDDDSDDGLDIVKKAEKLRLPEQIPSKFIPEKLRNPVIWNPKKYSFYDRI